MSLFDLCIAVGAQNAVCSPILYNIRVNAIGNANPICFTKPLIQIHDTYAIEIVPRSGVKAYFCYVWRLA